MIPENQLQRTDSCMNRNTQLCYGQLS